MNAIEKERLFARLNAKDREERLTALRALKAAHDAGEFLPIGETPFVNNHIHTTYSFSPYSPTMALYLAWTNGLKTAGIMDHDSASGAEEFIEAGKILGMPVTCGVEVRVDCSDTPLAGRRINNPDQVSIAYCALHGIPHQNLARVNEWLAPYRAAREARNRKMCENLTSLLSGAGLTLDYDADVRPLSMAHEGGSVTERHILFALAKKLTSLYRTPAEVVDFLRNGLGITVSPKAERTLLEGGEGSLFYEYDLLGVLKSELVAKFYIPATDECPKVTEYIAMAEQVGAISAYAYLGDVGDSVTGDKKAQKFEDDYLPLLIDTLHALRFNAITYMPTRNTRAQLDRLMALCKANGFFEISGEDINSPRQSFLCKALEDPAFGHLITATYALIGHEKAATADATQAMFSPETVRRLPTLPERVGVYAEIGRE